MAKSPPPAPSSLRSLLPCSKSRWRWLNLAPSPPLRGLSGRQNPSGTAAPTSPYPDRHPLKRLGPFLSASALLGVVPPPNPPHNHRFTLSPLLVGVRSRAQWLWLRSETALRFRCMPLLRSLRSLPNGRHLQLQAVSTLRLSPHRPRLIEEKRCRSFGQGLRPIPRSLLPYLCGVGCALRLAPNLPTK